MYIDMLRQALWGLVSGIQHHEVQLTFRYTGWPSRLWFVTSRDVKMGYQWQACTLCCQAMIINCLWPDLCLGYPKVLTIHTYQISSLGSYWRNYPSWNVLATTLEWKEWFSSVIGDFLENIKLLPCTFWASRAEQSLIIALLQAANIFHYLQII